MNQVAGYKNGPLEFARALQAANGAVFLDSGSSEKGLSLLASEPDLILEGRDWKRLEAELQRRHRPGSGSGFPDGAAVGHVSFEGFYRFAFYENLHLFSHKTGQWITSPPPVEPVPQEKKPEEAVLFVPQVRREDFLKMVERARAYIAAGDIYQVCLSHPFVAEKTAVSAWDFYERLRHVSPAPYSAYLNFPGLQIASSSPECFLRLSGRRISTRPIKGTRPRKTDSQQDLRSASDLLTSPKEIAELIMITDLERNDLGRVCEYGSVQVKDLLHLETYEQVFHLVSTVEGILRGEVSHVRALQECFPGGSISGAPKSRALEIIRELEPHPRGLYTGAIGYLGYNGESQFSIAIRTAVFENTRASFHVGAGIVADSRPEKEWQETLDKAAGLLLAAELPRGENPTVDFCLPAGRPGTYLPGHGG